MLSTTNTIQNFASGGSTFPVTLVKIIDVDTVNVHFIDEFGVEQSELIYEEPLITLDNLHYNVTDITDTGFIVNLGANSDSGGVISIRRVVDKEQKTHWPTGGNFPAATHERSADKITMLIQEHGETLNRVVRTPYHEDSTDMVIPELSERSNGIMGFDENGVPIMHAGFLPKIYDPLYTYDADNILQYSGKFFIALQESTGNTPVGGPADAYWKMLNFDGINFDATNIFNTGDIVEYSGYLFKSLIDDNQVTPLFVSGDTSWRMIPQDTNFHVAVNYMTGETTSFGGYFFKSLVDNNQGNTPLLIAGDTNWRMIPTNMEHHPAVNYMTNEMSFFDGELYKSIIDDNQGNTPTSPDGDSNWERTFTKGDSAEIEEYSDAITYGINTVRVYDAIIYISIQVGNLDNQPDISPLWWKTWPHKVTISTSTPTGGADGDFWYEVEA